MWKVENPNDKKMYFSIGGHPAFNCPLKEGEKQEDCQLVFDTEGPLTSSILNEEGALCPRTKILNLFGKCLKLEEHLFDEDALIIENHQAQRIGLAEDKIKFHRGYTSICLEASPDNKAALALYHKLGYITLGMITVRKEIYKNDKKNETELFGLTYKY